MNATHARHQTNYQLGQVEVTLSCQDERQCAAIATLWEELFVLRKRTSAFESVTFIFSDVATSMTSSADPVYTSKTLSIFREANNFYLHCEASSLHVDILAGTAQGYLAEDFWQQSAYDQREFFLLSLLMLLRPRGLYGLHANGLVHRGQGLLIVGHSGAGKTTLTLSLIERGWQVLTDDAVLLHERNEGVQALALRRGFSCTAQTLARFPTLKPTSYSERSSDGKWIVQAGALEPNAFVTICTPTLIVFPQICGQVSSRLEQLTSTEALVLLSQQSAGIMTDRDISKRQLVLLAKLVEQARCYRLLAGTDVLDAPAQVSALLANALEA